MVSVNLKSLVGKLNPTTQRTLEGAAGLCLSRTNYNVELEHWLYKLVEEPDTDLTIIFKQFDVNPARVLQELTSSMDRFKTGNARPPALSPDLITAIREAWILGSVEYGSSLVRTGYLLAAILADETLGRTVAGASSELKQITAPQLLSQLAVLLQESREAGGEAISSKTASPSSGGQPVKP
ncbi:MAG: type VI secretion system ATPase TssH, partial [Rubinisphaera sp.]